MVTGLNCYLLVASQALTVDYKNPAVQATYYALSNLSPCLCSYNSLRAELYDFSQRLTQLPSLSTSSSFSLYNTIIN